MNKYETFMRILRNSKRYELRENVLTLTDYITGDQVELDLSLINKDIFDELVVEEDY